MQVTIQKWGNSQGIRIPKAFLEAVGMAVNDCVELERMDDNIIIKKFEHSAKVTLYEIFLCSGILLEIKNFWCISLL